MVRYDIGTLAVVKDYYAILGLSKNATYYEIKRAFCDKAKKIPPRCM
jgi:curved DNA-binding protein CbpA